MCLGQRGDALSQGAGTGDFRKRHDETLEFIVIVLKLASCRVRRFSMSSSLFSPSPRSATGSTLPSETGTTLTVRGSALAIRHRSIDAGGIEEIAPVETNEVGTSDLILEHFLDRVVVIEGSDQRRADSRALRDRRPPARSRAQRRPPPPHRPRSRGS